jgi:tRNA (guanine37-N1)-methyltransferase
MTTSFPLRIDIFTLFPAMFSGPFTESIVKRAVAAGKIEIGIHDIREWTTDKHHTADDTPYGGGAGMVMKAPPIVEAVEAVLGDDLSPTWIGVMAAGGERFTQAHAHELAARSRIALICGHYEGIDQRAIDILGAHEVSIGDFVLTGGEIPAMVIADTVIRLVPGVIDAASIADESHVVGDSPLVEYPHYTRPVTYRGHEVPPILLSGHHAKIDEWRREQSMQRTVRLRPDLIPSPGQPVADRPAHKTPRSKSTPD